jgi:isoleucyl-tRNA synthetase
MTLYTALTTVAKLSAPLVPFLAEDIYRNLVVSVDKDAPESVHLCDYPISDEAMIDKTLEKHMDEVLKVVVLGRSARNAATIKNRQPIGKMYVKADEALPAFFCDIICGELNVKEALFTDSMRDFTTYTFKPQLKTVGPKYGKYLGEIRAALATLDGNAAMDELEKDGVLTLALPSATVTLAKEDLLIEMQKKEGFAAAEDGGITVVLDTNLTEALLEEGFVNELVSKIQTMRKDSGFEVTDRIVISLSGDEKLVVIAKRNEAEIAKTVLADALEIAEDENGKKWNINGLSAVISVRKV